MDTYPSSKDVAGKAAWIFGHNWTANKIKDPTKPRKLTATERMKFRMIVNELPESISCDSCRQHYKEFVHINPPKVKTDIEAFVYLCKAHNASSENAGKTPVVDCMSLLQRAPTCPTCSVPQKQNNVVDSNTQNKSTEEAQPIKHSVQDSFKDYKNVSQKVVESM